MFNSANYSNSQSLTLYVHLYLSVHLEDSFLSQIKNKVIWHCNIIEHQVELSRNYILHLTFVIIFAENISNLSEKALHWRIKYFHGNSFATSDNANTFIFWKIIKNVYSTYCNCIVYRNSILLIVTRSPLNKWIVEEWERCIGDMYYFSWEYIVLQWWKFFTNPFPRTYQKHYLVCFHIINSSSFKETLSYTVIISHMVV